ncbi:nuclear transport factor 2 family protein [Aspergillus saccharolyticus JOP 1030-1]|uniref:SnoaL-like domain-containing protein n=1 Tax=Aspergillus saccharolyticus JOP 1030-1 TaxID=1450539 RepID=A0A318ZS70_9EURO|nr:hypothetical protein BP01DRAFT_393943 [Aspergillus saccharolyticus JOP 1030-1]PYH42928.1 hypothetical protein BP01DRAFT_393943 [Aspergillus saccharolyticus JOP 1030-1]
MTIYTSKFPSTLPKVPSQIKDAIVDPIYRILNAVDTSNPALFASAIHPAGRIDLNGRVFEGVDAITANVYDWIANLETMHHPSGIRVTKYDEANGTASLTATVIAQHYRRGKGVDSSARGLLAGAFYFVDVVREEGDSEQWRAKDWTLNTVWREGDMTVMTGEEKDGAKDE